MKKRLRILLAGANTYNANKGVGALAYSTIRILNKIAKDSNIDMDICIYTHESKRTYDTISLPEGDVKIQNIYPTHLFGIKNFIKTAFSKWRLYNLRELIKCDYILNITAGDSFSDIYSASHFASVNDINKLAALLKIKYSFLPQTYGPFYNKNIERDAIKSLVKADVLFSRDRRSSEYLHKIVPNAIVKDLIDVAFYLPYSKRQNHLVPGINVGVNISQTLWSVPKNNKISLNQDYREIVYSTIDYLLAKGCVVHIVPHVVDADNDPINEYFLSYRIWEKYNSSKVRLAPLFLSPVDAKSYISGLDMFVGARMHACIAAFSSGVPVLPMSYSRKFEGLFRDTLGYNNCVNLTKIADDEEVRKSIDILLSNIDSTKQEILRINETIVKPYIQKIYVEIKSILMSL